MITYHWIQTITGAEIERVVQLQKDIFENPFESDRIKDRLTKQRDVQLHVAQHKDQWAGFKMGYRQSEDIFYSWLGGVLPAYRKQGIGLQLMERQHQDAKKLGYKRIQTKSRNQFPEMMRLNLKSGFRIVGLVYKAEIKDFSIVFEKTISD